MGSNFDFKRYLIRAIKQLITFLIALTLIIGVFSITSGKEFRFDTLFRPGTGTQLTIFLLVMSLIYPLFGYVTRKVHLNKSFEEDQTTIKDIFFTNRYVIEGEGKGFVIFRHKSSFIRTMKLFEDTITVDVSDNPIKLEGPRKDVYRLGRMIEYAIRDLDKQ